MKGTLESLRGWGPQQEGALPQEGLQMANSWPGVAVTHPTPAGRGMLQTGCDESKGLKEF